MDHRVRLRDGAKPILVRAGADEGQDLIAELAKPSDYVVCLGAGTITQWAYALPDWLAASEPKRAGAAR